MTSPRETFVDQTADRIRLGPNTISQRRREIRPRHEPSMPPAVHVMRAFERRRIPDMPLRRAREGELRPPTRPQRHDEKMTELRLLPEAPGPPKSIGMG